MCGRGRRPLRRARDDSQSEPECDHARHRDAEDGRHRLPRQADAPEADAGGDGLDADRTGAEITLRALELGAIDFVAKPKIGVADGLLLLAEDITDKIRIACEGAPAPAVPRRWRRRGRPTPSTACRGRAPRAIGRCRPRSIIFIGASTGGTEATKRSAASLPPDAPAVVITQHMPAGFTKSYAQRLDGLCRIRVAEARDGERILPGHAVHRAGRHHLSVERERRELHRPRADGEPVNRHMPSVEVLFESAARVAAPNALGMMLTGMGADGAKAMREMHDAGGYNLAQDEASCVVFGMPREAIAAGAAHEVLPLTQIAPRLIERLRSTSGAVAQPRLSPRPASCCSVVRATADRVRPASVRDRSAAPHARASACACSQSGAPMSRSIASLSSAAASSSRCSRRRCCARPQAARRDTRIMSAACAASRSRQAQWPGAAQAERAGKAAGVHRGLPWHRVLVSIGAQLRRTESICSCQIGRLCLPACRASSAAHPAHVPRGRTARQPARRGRGAAPDAQRRQPADPAARGAARLRAVRAPRPAHRAERRRRRVAARGRSGTGAARRWRARRRRGGLGRCSISCASRWCRRSRSAGCCRAWVGGASGIPTSSIELHASQQVVDLQREGLSRRAAAGRRPVARARGRAADRLAADRRRLARRRAPPDRARRRRTGRRAAARQRGALGTVVRAGRGARARESGRSVQRCGLLLQAAEQNLGIALGRELFAADALHDGRLVRLSPQALPDTSVDAFWLVYPPSLRDWPPLIALRHWLRDRAGAFAAHARRRRARQRAFVGRPITSRQEQRLQIGQEVEAARRRPSARRVALDQAARLRPRPAARRCRWRQPGALAERRQREALAQPQRVEHELERQLRARDFVLVATPRWPASASPM